MIQSRLGQLIFPPTWSDEQKIVFCFQHKITIREIKQHFHFGSTKICLIIHEYKQTNEIPKPLKQHPAHKLTLHVLLHIQNCILNDANVTLNQMKNSIFEILHVQLTHTTVSEGCAQLRYHYKPPQKTHDLTEDQKLNRLSFAYNLLTKESDNEVDLSTIIFLDESRFVEGDDRQWVWRTKQNCNSQTQKISKIINDIWSYRLKLQIRACNCQKINR